LHRVTIISLFFCVCFAFGANHDLAIDTDHLDLDTGSVESNAPGSATIPWDVRIAPGLQVGDFEVRNNALAWVYIHHLVGATYANVGWQDTFNAPWSLSGNSTPFASGTTVLIMTEQGRFFKLGNPVADTQTWTFSFDAEEILPPPPPQRDAYLTPSVDYIDLDSGQIWRDQWSSAPVDPWDLSVETLWDPITSMETPYIATNGAFGGLSLVHLEGSDYASVDWATAMNAPNWTIGSPTTPAAQPDLTVVLWTTDNRVFKLGRFHFDDYAWQMGFDYEELFPPIAPVRDEYLTIGADYHDLDAGAIDRDQWPGPPVTPWDIAIGSEWDPVTSEERFYVRTNALSLAHLVGADFATVDFVTATNAGWTSGSPTTPAIATDLVVVVLSSDGRLFKLGNFYFDTWQWQMGYDWEELTPPAPPARDVFLAIDTDYLDLDTGTAYRGYFGGEPIEPWDVKITTFWDPVTSSEHRVLSVNDTMGLSYAELPGAVYPDVDFDDGVNATWIPWLPADPAPIDESMVYLVHSTEGHTFKIGQLFFDEFAWQMGFEFEELLPVAPPGRDTYLTIESEFLDLDTATTYQSIGPEPVEPWDVTATVAYDPVTYAETHHLKTNQMIGVGMAYILSGDYAAAGFDDAVAATWSTTDLSPEVSADTVIFLFTNEGRTFKLGHFHFDVYAWTLGFDVEELVPPAPPVRTAYLTPGSDYLDIDTGQTWLDQWSGTPIEPWDVAIQSNWDPINSIETFNLRQNTGYWLSVGYLEQADYATVDFTTAWNHPNWNNPSPSDPVLAEDLVVLIWSTEGRLFKVGNFHFDSHAWQWGLDYEELFPPAPPSRDLYLAIDSEGLDLDVDAIYSELWSGNPSDPWDARIVSQWNPTTSESEFVVEPNWNHALSIATLSNTSYPMVSWGEAMTASWSSGTSQPIDQSMTVLVTTTDGRTFKLGNFSFDEFTWRYGFDYEELQP